MEVLVDYLVTGWYLLGASAAAVRGLCPYLVRGRTVPVPADAVPDGRVSRAAVLLHSAAQRPPPRRLADDAIVPGRQEKTVYLSLTERFS